MTVTLAAIILTYNEQKHIERCINSVKDVAESIFVVDSFSTDETVNIAEQNGAQVYKNNWTNYANQLNWALEHLPIRSEWILRIDADEILSEGFSENLKRKVQDLNNSVSGLFVKRKIVFMNKWIKFGGMYPIWNLRIWRNGKGRCEKRWMDEHIKLIEGDIAYFDQDIIDHNLNNLSWWTSKHNAYATREAADLLNIRYNFMQYDSIESSLAGPQAERKRWLKIKYAQMPLFIRPLFYFFFRYFFKLGFLDGIEGLIWHCLQGLWYRFLVDAKIYEVHAKCGNDPKKVLDFLSSQYGITFL